MRLKAYDDSRFEVVFEDRQVHLPLLKDTWLKPNSLISVAQRVEDQLSDLGGDVTCYLPEGNHSLHAGYVLLKVANAPSFKSWKAVHENVGYLQYSQVPPLSAQIDQKYAELIALRDAKQYKKEAYAKALADLKALRHQEAEALEKRFSAKQEITRLKR